MQVQFAAKENGPERLVCDAQVLFDEPGPLYGTKLVGFSLWRSVEGELYVTFPSRAFGAGADRRYFEYLRSIDNATDAVRNVKQWILVEFRKSQSHEAPLGGNGNARHDL